MRSGLLVSRREHSYRFVHLTFQEYLAAWQLSNQEFNHATSGIEPHLRQQRWFEPLQLLGGEWAKQSDEKLDHYLQWLLDRQGESVIERAPVVALCANIVKDMSGVAELTSETRKMFQNAVEDTLDAFRPTSGVPVLTQLEILEALGQLGSAVKSHLIDATKSGLNQVRSRAIEMLLPHLSDDELFSMDHLLNDRSKEPIKTYLLCLLGRDAQRTAKMLIQQERLSEKTAQGVTEILYEFVQKLPEGLLRETVRTILKRPFNQLHYWLFRRTMDSLLKHWHDPKIRLVLSEFATVDDNQISNSALFAIVLTPLFYEEWRILQSHSTYWWQLAIDIQKPITRDKAADLARKPPWSEIEVRRLFERIAGKLHAYFGLELRLEWCEGADK